MTKFISKTCPGVINAKSKPFFRHSETLRTAVSASNKKGFTLIELLVVVLIIGILSSVALPQYQTAVRKARYTKLMAAAKTYKDAFESYYLANGTYPAYWGDVDISFEGCTESPSAYYMLWCPDFSADSNVNPTNGTDRMYLNFFTNPDHNKEGASSSSGNLVFAIGLDRGPDAGKRYCAGDGAVCKSLGGVQDGYYYLLP